MIRAGGGNDNDIITYREMIEISIQIFGRLLLIVVIVEMIDVPGVGDGPTLSVVVAAAAEFFDGYWP